jgi:ketosteroid isomerase-like protein
VEARLTPEEFLRLYERKASSRHFEDVSPLIADDAVFWFNDGSYAGKESIRKAFESTWALEIQDEKYWLDNVSWLANEERFAVCTYSFHWTGVVKGRFRELGRGRETCILRRSGSDWKIIHEHLSREPTQQS